MSNLYSPKILFTSDLHLLSGNVINYCYRPYSTANEMSEDLVARYNSKVSPLDTVYILGDFCWSGRAREYMKRLNGNKHFVLGNHDKVKDFKDMVRDGIILSCSDTKFIKIGEDSIFLSHYPHRSWKNSFHGSYHLYGHTHNTLANHGKSTDVGVDKWDYYPVSWEEIKEHLKGNKNEN